MSGTMRVKFVSIGACICVAAATASAQTFTVLTHLNPQTGGAPRNALIQGSDQNFYGTCGGGLNASGPGTIFQVTSTGAFTVLHDFQTTDGSGPFGGLAAGNDGYIYGTTFAGGTNNYGTIFKISTSGTLTTLYNFNLTDGANPFAGLLLATDGNFYGTTKAGGTKGDGTIFRVTSSGTVTSLHSFTAK